MGSGDLPEQEPLKVTPGWAMRRARRPEERVDRTPVYEPPPSPLSSERAAELVLAPRRPAEASAASGPDATPADPAVTPPPPWEVVRQAVPEQVELRRSGVLSEGERFWVFTTRTPAPPRMRPPLGSVLSRRTPAPAGKEASWSDPAEARPRGRGRRRERATREAGPLELPTDASLTEGRLHGVRGLLLGVTLLAAGVVIAVGVGLLVSPVEAGADNSRGTVTVEAPERPGGLPF